jgi:glycosyltransferase involved in cell wall biosynthesis
LEELPRGMGVVISIHDMWHVTGGCFLYRGCDLYSLTCKPCPILRSPANRFLAADEQTRKVRAYHKCRARLIANSHWLAEIAGRSPIAKACGGVRVISPGIDTTVFKPQDKSLCRRHLGLPESAFVIVTGGASLTDTNKNVSWLFEQLQQLADLPGVIVLAFGEGTVPVPDRLDVRFTGGIRDRHDLAGLLTAADVFVSGSQMETYGMTLVEAIACGTPIVAFRVGGIPEAAPEGQGALLCAPQDGAELIEAIMKLKNSPQLREMLGMAGREIVRVRNHLSSFSSLFEGIYRECVLSRENAERKESALVL